MMHSVYFEWAGREAERRQRLYQGQLFVYAPRPAMLRLVAHANAMIAEAFHPLDPQTAQYEMPVERFVAICALLKPRFIHHPTTIERDWLQQRFTDVALKLDSALAGHNNDDHMGELNQRFAQLEQRLGLPAHARALATAQHESQQGCVSHLEIPRRDNRTCHRFFPATGSRG